MDCLFKNEFTLRTFFKWHSEKFIYYIYACLYCKAFIYLFIVFCTIVWYQVLIFNIIYTPFCDVSICDVTLLPRYIVLKTLDVFCLVYYFVTHIQALFICYFMQTLDFKLNPRSSYFKQIKNLQTMRITGSSMAIKCPNVLITEVHIWRENKCLHIHVVLFLMIISSLNVFFNCEFCFYALFYSNLNFFFYLSFYNKCNVL